MVGRELSAADHPKKEVRAVLDRLVAQGWKLCKEGHWGRLYCPCEGRCLTIPVPGTPQNAGRAARKIAARAGLCPLPNGDPRRAP
ncbi:hypothetical protein OIE49_09245 [Streptomyces sp. NBC_01788]|uniref:hypothetical protein n=1 Tax=Streptomyces sp. NBC_01788 TaxID=2975940 RepID=UPI002DDA365B|nr:hypothetical protein [Streptomyces sp. NBC_01788]WSB26055.1 hypothetical protein OIE49_09245 [Streptomyces sp. NBC_01788]